MWKRENSGAVTPGGMVRRRCVTRGAMQYLYLVPKESVKCIGGEDARRIATDGVTIEEEGREEGSEADGLIDRFFYKAVTLTVQY